MTGCLISHRSTAKKIQEDQRNSRRFPGVVDTLRKDQGVFPQTRSPCQNNGVKI